MFAIGAVAAILFVPFNCSFQLSALYFDQVIHFGYQNPDMSLDVLAQFFVLWFGYPIIFAIFAELAIASEPATQRKSLEDGSWFRARKKISKNKIKKKRKFSTKLKKGLFTVVKIILA